MGDGVTDDKDLVIKVDSHKAGGDTGQLILNDVSWEADRDNTAHVGIGNDEAQAMGYGNKTFTVSTEAVVNEAAADLLITLYENDQSPSTAFIKANGTVEASIGKLDWNNLSWDAQDDDSVTISLDADCRDVELNPLN